MLSKKILDRIRGKKPVIVDIKQIIKDLKIETFVEIGMHFGTDTQDFRRMHPNSRIVCFEPDPRNIEMIKNIIVWEDISNLPQPSFEFQSF